jgi:hypothetical protein
MAGIYTMTPSYRTPAQLHDSLPSGSTRNRAINHVELYRKKRRADFFSQGKYDDTAEYTTTAARGSGASTPSTPKSTVDSASTLFSLEHRSTDRQTS